MDYEIISNLFSNLYANDDDDNDDSVDIFDVNTEYSNKDLHDNIMNGNLEYIIKYLSDGGNPNHTINNINLLLTAVYYNKKSIVNLLIKHNVDLEYEEIDGETALGYAARFENVDIDILKILLDSGANPNHLSQIAIRNGGISYTPLMLCIKSVKTNFQRGKDYFDKLKLLLEYGADPNIVDRYGSNSLFIAIDELYNKDELSETLKLLFIYGANIDSVDGYTDGILFRARLKNTSDALVILLEWGADPYIRNKYGYDVFLDNYFAGNNNYIGNRPSHTKIFYETIDRLHKTNVAYQMLEISKGLDGEHPIENLDEDTLYELYQSLLKQPYNPFLTRSRKFKDLNDIITYGKYVKTIKKGGKRSSKKRSSKNSYRKHSIKKNSRNKFTKKKHNIYYK